MNEGLGIGGIIGALADESAKTVTNQVINDMQMMDVLSLAYEDILQSRWDEVCVLVKEGDISCGSAFEYMVKACVYIQVDQLPNYKSCAIWLQTTAADEWIYDNENSEGPFPFTIDEIVDYILEENVYPAAREWSNERIKNCINRIHGWD